MSSSPRDRHDSLFGAEFKATPCHQRQVAPVEVHFCFITSHVMVLKPPGGGSSNIFGAPDVPEATPRRRNQSHLQSSVLPGCDMGTPARAKPGNNSYERLFGEPEPRQPSATKNRLKSNIPIGVDKLNDKLVNGSAHNGYDTHKGWWSTRDLEMQLFLASSMPKCHLTLQHSATLFALDGVNYRVCGCARKSACMRERAQGMPLALCCPMTSMHCTGTGIVYMAIQRIVHSRQFSNWSHYGIENSKASVAQVWLYARRDIAVVEQLVVAACEGLLVAAYLPRNPVTGLGMMDRDSQVRRSARRRDGNPVTGEGYVATNAEKATVSAGDGPTTPAVNGTSAPAPAPAPASAPAPAPQQSNAARRVPPGGFSSGL
ncbi:hypothetical protein PR048_014408, partial [Dryococelus australis]